MRCSTGKWVHCIHVNLMNNVSSRSELYEISFSNCSNTAFGCKYVVSHDYGTIIEKNINYSRNDGYYCPCAGTWPSYKENLAITCTFKFVSFENNTAINSGLNRLGRKGSSEYCINSCNFLSNNSNETSEENGLITVLLNIIIENTCFVNNRCKYFIKQEDPCVAKFKNCYIDMDVDESVFTNSGAGNSITFSNNLESKMTNVFHNRGEKMCLMQRITNNRCTCNNRKKPFEVPFLVKFDAS